MATGTPGAAISSPNARSPDSEARRKDWQKDYYRGHAPAGLRFEEHQTAIETKEFSRVGPGPD